VSNFGAQRVGLDPDPAARIDRSASSGEIERDLQKTTIVLEADVALYPERRAAIDGLAPHRPLRDAAHHAIGDHPSTRPISGTRIRRIQIVNVVTNCHHGRPPQLRQITEQVIVITDA